MITSWRLTKIKYLGTCFSGDGGRTTPGRWNQGGRRIVYTSESAALATLETVVHLDEATMLKHYRLRRAMFDDALVLELADNELPADWQRQPAPASTQAIGERWLQEQPSAVLRVPSVVVPGFNYLLNPDHPDFLAIDIPAGDEALDPRILETFTNKKPGNP